MMTIGEVVRAAVTRAEVYGLYLACDGQDLLVLIPEVAWTTEVRDCRDFAGVGDEFDVKVLAFDEKTGLHWGSIKQAHPEDDPWRDPEAFRPGTIWVGTVTHRYSARRSEWGPSGYIVRLWPGVSGLLREAEGGKDLTVGDRVRGPGRRGRCPIKTDRPDPVAPSRGVGSGIERWLRRDGLARREVYRAELPRTSPCLPTGTACSWPISAPSFRCPGPPGN